MSRYKWFLLFLISFLAGIFAGEFLKNGNGMKLAVLAVLWVYALCAVFRERKAWIILFSFLGVGLGIFRFFLSFQEGEGYIQNFEGYFEVEGCIHDEVDVRNDKVKYILDTEKILSDDEWREVKGNLLVNGDRYPVFNYGDCLNVAGKIELPGMIDDFSYDKYLSRYSIYAVMYKARISRVSESGGGGFYGFIYDFKDELEERLAKIFAEPHASFMAGLILGSRKGIPEHLMNDFNTTGLTHIVAISGYNITLVIVVVGGIFNFLSRRKKALACGVFIFVFTILVGASAAVVRAAVMGVISLMALASGRPYMVMISLFGAAGVMSMWNPKILVYDVGFQLSFLATFGIIFISPFIGKYLQRVPGILGVRESLQMTLSAQVFALPVILLNFGRLSIISPIANVFVLPFIPLAMIFGFFAIIFSLVSQWLGSFVGFFGYIFLEIIIFFVKTFAGISFASLDMEWTPWWGAVIYYFILFRIFILPPLRNSDATQP